MISGGFLIFVYVSKIGRLQHFNSKPQLKLNLIIFNITEV